jgi:hypothetical protein
MQPIAMPIRATHNFDMPGAPPARSRKGVAPVQTHVIELLFTLFTLL